MITTADVLQDNLASLDPFGGTLLGMIQHAQSLFQMIADLDNRPPNDLVRLAIHPKALRDMIQHLHAFCAVRQ